MPPSLRRQEAFEALTCGEGAPRGSGTAVTFKGSCTSSPCTTRSGGHSESVFHQLGTELLRGRRAAVPLTLASGLAERQAGAEQSSEGLPETLCIQRAERGRRDRRAWERECGHPWTLASGMKRAWGGGCMGCQVCGVLGMQGAGCMGCWVRIAQYKSCWVCLVLSAWGAGCTACRVLGVQGARVAGCVGCWVCGVLGQGKEYSSTVWPCHPCGDAGGHGAVAGLTVTSWLHGRTGHAEPIALPGTLADGGSLATVTHPLPDAPLPTDTRSPS